MLKDYTIEEFLDILSSSAPSPGGGSASALCGAIGSSLIHMVASLTAGKEKYKDVAPLANRVLMKSEEFKKKFIELIDEDVKGFTYVSEVYKMPKTTDEEKIIRNTAMQEALKKAIMPPFEMIKAGEDTLKLLSECVEKFNRSALSDLGVASIALISAIKGAYLNIVINLKGLHDESFKEFYAPLSKTVLKAEKMANYIYHCVEEKLS